METVGGRIQGDRWTVAAGHWQYSALELTDTVQPTSPECGRVYIRTPDRKLTVSCQTTVRINVSEILKDKTHFSCFDLLLWYPSM